MTFGRYNLMNKGVLLTLGSVVAWATTPVAARILLNDSPVFELLFFNSIFATIFFVSICTVKGKLKELIRFKRKDYLNFFIMGLLGVFLSYLTLFVAISFMPPQKAFIMNYTWPLIMVVLASLFLNEKMTVAKSSGVFISFIGVIVVVSEGNFSQWDFSITGTLVALMGALSYALYSTMTKRVNYDQLLATTAMVISFLILSATSYLLFGLYKYSSDGNFQSTIPSIDFTELAGYAFMGIVPTGLGYLFWMFALKHADVTKISNVVYLTPFVSLLFIRVVLGNPIFVSSIVGAAIIVTGIFLEKLVTKQIFVPELEGQSAYYETRYRLAKNKPLTIFVASETTTKEKDSH